MDENATPHATEDSDSASPFPFRRFPYVQLVFCAACLAMTAWTWMRYSYAWDFRVQDVWTVEGASGEASPRLTCEDRYTAMSGTVLQTWSPEEVVLLAYEDGPMRTVIVLGPHERLHEGDAVSFRGRMAVTDSGYFSPSVNTAASRFHPASIAGLVVGAMGCFIFGLYLRRWLRERKAA